MVKDTALPTKLIFSIMHGNNDTVGADVAIGELVGLVVAGDGALVIDRGAAVVGEVVGHTFSPDIVEASCTMWLGAF